MTQVKESGNISQFPGDRRVNNPNELRLNEDPWTNTDIPGALGAYQLRTTNGVMLNSLIHSAIVREDGTIGFAKILTDKEKRSVMFKSAAGDFYYTVEDVEEIITRDGMVAFRKSGENNVLGLEVYRNGAYALRIEPTSVIDQSDPQNKSIVFDAVRKDEGNF